MRIPHLILAVSLLLAGSFNVAAADRTDVVAESDYGGPLTAVVARGNMAGTQFHPEKSQRLGLALIGNFLTWRP